MGQSGDKNTGGQSATASKSISVHRAFVYGASAPGLGEYYAGSRLRGLITAALFISGTIWFTYTLFIIISTIVGRIFDSFNSATPLVLPDVPYISAAVSLFALYFIWLWAIIGAIDAATAHRCKCGEPPQTSVGWAVAAAWFCPGSGHVYAGSRRFGYLLFAAYLLAFLAIVPAYTQLFNDISRLAGSGELTPHDPYAVVGIVHALTARVEHSFGKLLQASIRYFAIADAVRLLQHDLPEADTRWTQPSAGYGLALVGLGWLCPGAGQLLQKRDTLGWYFLAAYIGSQLFTGFFFQHHFITLQTSDLLDWIPVAIQWGAMAEALLWMIRQNKERINLR